MTLRSGPPFEWYNFGLYHWRTRGRRLLVSLLGFLGGLAVLRDGRRSQPLRAVAAAVTAVCGINFGAAAASLLRPPPWMLDREKYEALGDELSISNGDLLLDVGCGTGRSLVGLSAAVPAGCSVVGLDVFDDRIILGNGPRLAVRNAERAGLETTTVRGDATRLPLADGTVDTVTICRVLHDLSAADAGAVLEGVRRVCVPGGTVGVLALPYPHDTAADPTDYWREMVSTAGFRVETVVTRDDGYTVIIAEPGPKRLGAHRPPTGT